MGLEVFWFIVIAILWTGFFILEGFDFGVGMLHDVVGRNDDERSAAMETIGPLWDGNEVWLIVAGAAMFAAFPGWYATMFSGFYPALVLLLVASSFAARRSSSGAGGKGRRGAGRGTGCCRPAASWRPSSSAWPWAASSTECRSTRSRSSPAISWIC
jgi:hypothetical protein